jgi:hypothetical protein
MISRSDSISVSELFSQLLAFENCLDLRYKNNSGMSGSSANAANRGIHGRRGFGRGYGRTSGRGGRSGRGSLASRGGCGSNLPRS